MRLGRTCQRFSLRTLKILACGLGLVLTGTASCTDQVISAALVSAEELALSVVEILFASIDFGDVTTTTGGTSDSARMLVEALGRMIV